MGDKVVIDEQVFTDIADAIRDRNGETATYKPREMAAAVEDLHNVRVKKWVRPSDWPDYSKVDLTDQEVIYLTYDCTYDDRAARFLVRSAYTVERGSLSNGVFTAVETINMADNVKFEQDLPTDEGDYVVYRITPQEGYHITSFKFSQGTDPDASSVIASWLQPCVERYANVPNLINSFYSSGNDNTWATRFLVADTVMKAKPVGNCGNAYNIGGTLLKYVNLSTCSFVDVTNFTAAFYNQYHLIECYLPHDLGSKCTNLSNVFCNCKNLTNLDLSNWDTSAATTFQNMFNGCNKLIDINGINDLNFTSATTLNSFLYGCNSLERLDTSKWVTTNALTNIEFFLRDVRNITYLDLNGFIVDNVTSFAFCFAGIYNLKTINISSWNITNKAVNLNGMFSYNNRLINIIRSKNWDTSNTTGLSEIFREDRSLKEIDLSDFDFSKATTVRYLFMHCNSLRKIKANMNLALVTNKTNVTDFATNCWMLEDLSELSITNSTYMPGFGYDYSIKNFVIPSSVTTIADNSLRDLQHCRVLDFRNFASVPTLNAATDIINGMNAFLMIVVPDSLYDNWIAATNWSNASIRPSIIKASDYEYYLNTSSVFTDLDLSQCIWVKNSNFSSSAAVGTAYASTVTNGSGNRICSGLIDIPDDTTIYIHANDGYQFSFMSYDSSGNNLKILKEWCKNWYFISNSTIKKIALFVRLGDGTTVLPPENWADSGITVSYAP